MIIHHIIQITVSSIFKLKIFAKNIIINSNFIWKQAGYATQGDTAQLPTDYRELLLILNAPDSSSYSFIYPKAMVDAFELYPTNGGYMNGAYYCINLILDKTYAGIDRVNINGSDFTNQSSLYVFYR